MPETGDVQTMEPGEDDAALIARFERAAGAVWLFEDEWPTNTPEHAEYAAAKSALAAALAGGRADRESDAEEAEYARLYRVLVVASEKCGSLDYRTPDGARLYIRPSRKPTKPLHEWLARAFPADTPEQAAARAQRLAELRGAATTEAR